MRPASLPACTSSLISWSRPCSSPDPTNSFAALLNCLFSFILWTCLIALSICFSLLNSLLQDFDSGSDRRHFRICSIPFSVSPAEKNNIDEISRCGCIIEGEICSTCSRSRVPSSTSPLSNRHRARSCRKLKDALAMRIAVPAWLTHASHSPAFSASTARAAAPSASSS